jgi:hypothetical protein
VRLRLAHAERARRIEAIHQPVAIEEEQTILRPAPRREEQQGELVSRQPPVAVEEQAQMLVALGQVTRQLEDPLRAHPHPAGAGVVRS